MEIKDWSRYVPQEAVVFDLEVAKTLRFNKVGEATIDAHKDGSMDVIKMPSLVLDVIEEDGKKVIKKWYVASKKAIMLLKPYIEDGTYRRRLFKVTKHGKAPAAFYDIEVGPLA